jgi:hypothetical protein
MCFTRNLDVPVRSVILDFYIKILQLKEKNLVGTLAVESEGNSCCCRRKCVGIRTMPIIERCLFATLAL